MTAESNPARRGGLATALAALLLCLWIAAPAAAETTGAFAGVKVNGGTVSHSVEGGVHYLTLSDDFKPPDTPDPHWQVVDSMGKTHLLQRLMVKNDGYNAMIAVPPYVHDVARVQIWCAFAETLLGEASFARPVATGGGSMR